MKGKNIKYSQEVKTAIETGRPVVALESTIVAHGMPYPENVKTALEVERIIRANGASPATIAIIEGQMCAGLETSEIEALGKRGLSVPKVSRRDIPFILARKAWGATTVASTMIIAERAGISIFATGGIGGVHRGAEKSMDISADLEELALSNVAVVSAGAKSILDLKLTLEYLETKGVPVIGFGTDEFPAFYTRKSGLGVDYRIDEVNHLAEALKIKWENGLKGGVLIANPIPEKAAMEFGQVEEAIQQAIKDAAKLGHEGKALTPYLLGRIKELTGGKSLAANIQLVYNNAALAAKLAVAYSKLAAL